MIRYIQGNLLEAGAEALVNTVNTEGVMGKGIALQFKEAFPDAYEQYRQACEKGEVRVVRELGIHSIALPPLGCGHGGLDWRQIRPLIAEAMGALSDVDVLVFEPTVVYQGEKKRGGVEQLTPARALIVDAVRRY